MEEEKIILTQEEFAYLEKYMKGDVDFAICDEEEQKVWSKIFDKIDYWEEKLNAFDTEVMQEQGCDGVIWFYKKYMQQEGKTPMQKIEKKFLYS